MLAFLPVPDRVAFTIFGIDIMWYGVLITVGMLLAVLIVYLRAPGKGLDRERTIDFALVGIIAGVIGARLYYVVFEWGYYSQHLKEIFAIRDGGLAIHGGLIFGVGLAFLLGHFRWKQNMLEWLDLIAPVIALAQAIGRWGNYFNSEAHGTPTDLPWAIEVDGQMVHPTFLYESIWCFLLFLFLIWFDRKGRKKYSGQILVLYLILYSIERFFVEGLRTDSLMIGPLRQAQVISIGTIIVAALIGHFALRPRGLTLKKAAAPAAETPAEAPVAETPVEAPASEDPAQEPEEKPAAKAQPAEESLEKAETTSEDPQS